MLSTLLVSALLALQTGFAVADSTGRKDITPAPATHKPRGNLLVRQSSTCPAGSFLCDNGTGCCDIGTTCGYRASDNYPICEGGTCNGGPICASGLCCDLGYVCDEVAKLCSQDLSGGGFTLSSSAPTTTVGSSTRQSSVSRAATGSTRTLTRTLSAATPTETSTDVSTDDSTPSSSSDFFNFDDSSTSSSPQTTDASNPTSGGSNFQPTSVGATFSHAALPIPTGAADSLSVNSGMKVVAGAMAGVLAFML